jgi:SagB-type dehydrogenase family enzyme
MSQLNFALIMIAGWFVMSSQPSGAEEANSVIKLPAPRLQGEHSLEDVLAKRRSIRDYSNAPLSLAEVSQLLWAAQGITGADGGRTAPSAGALYPLEIYLVAGSVLSLDAGVYHYRPAENRLIRRSSGDKRAALTRAALKQECVRDCAAVVVFAAVYSRTKKKYGERGARYVHIEVGHAAQSLCLQATALGLGAVPVGAFDDDDVRKATNLPSGERVLYLVPVGKIE